ncbi:MAG: hypothetical protein KH034_03400 [Lachnospiraceae bacterium]|jgi:uncharacterized phage protein (TIGR01671 family)|nr:hypothetical protein [Lachnospiraceae bacterium]
MNREILFKAKRKDNGEWVEGGYFSEPYTEKKFIICWNSFGLGFNEFIEVDPDTLCQFTGLTDKNGKRIWENDIVRDKTGDIFRIYWSEQHLNYSAKCVKSTFSVFINQKWDLGTLLKSQIDVEVCGNIFDSADLLEVE